MLLCPMAHTTVSRIKKISIDALCTWLNVCPFVLDISHILLA